MAADFDGFGAVGDRGDQIGELVDFEVLAAGGFGDFHEARLV